MVQLTYECVFVIAMQAEKTQLKNVKTALKTMAAAATFSNGIYKMQIKMSSNIH